MFAARALALADELESIFRCQVGHQLPAEMHSEKTREALRPVAEFPRELLWSAASAGVFPRQVGVEAADCPETAAVPVLYVVAGSQVVQGVGFIELDRRY